MKMKNFQVDFDNISSLVQGKSTIAGTIDDDSHWSNLLNGEAINYIHTISRKFETWKSIMSEEQLFVMPQNGKIVNLKENPPMNLFNDKAHDLGTILITEELQSEKESENEQKELKKRIAALRKELKLDEDVPANSTADIPDPKDTVQGPRKKKDKNKPQLVVDRRYTKKVGQPVLLKRFRDYNTDKGIS